jgi:hypothetical protein
MSEKSIRRSKGFATKSGFEKEIRMNDKKEWVLKPYIRTLAVILVLSAVALSAMAFSTQTASGESQLFIQDDNDPDPPYWGGGMRGLPGFGHHGGFHFGAGSDYDSFLADALGISVDKLQAAYAAANEAALDQAVEDGLISEEDAVLIKARWALAATIDQQAIMAEALGISTDELLAAREDGTTLHDLMDELGLDPEDVSDAAQAGYEEAVQDAVNSGVITQAQADEILDTGFGGFFFDGPRGFRRHGGGFFPGGLLGPNSGSNQDTNL